MIHLFSLLVSKIQLYRHRRYVMSQVCSGMHLGKNVMICPGVKFDPPHSFLTSIGNNCTIAPDVRFLNHDAALFRLGQCASIGKIVIEENCFIGAGSLLLPGITIGANSIIGAYSVVTKSIAPDSVVAGNPAKPIRKTSEYLKQTKAIFEDAIYPGYKSAEFYPFLNDSKFRCKVINEMTDGRAFTLGSDENYSYHFNRQ